MLLPISSPFKIFILLRKHKIVRSALDLCLLSHDLREAPGAFLKGKIYIYTSKVEKKRHFPASSVGQVCRLRSRSGLQQIGNCLQGVNDWVVLTIFLLICANHDKEQYFATLQTCIHISRPKVHIAMDILVVLVIHYLAFSASSDY